MTAQVSRLPGASPVDVAARLHAAALADRQDPALAGEIAVFRAASAENERAWNACTAILSGVDALPRDARMEAMLTQARAVRGFAYGRLAAAAAVVAVGVVSFASWDKIGTSGPTSLASAPAAERIVATGVGERKLVRLADGSTAMLNTDSRLRVRAFDGASRSLVLDRGEAYFDVAHDRTRPFTVHADAVSVTALGTRFTVRKQAAGLKIVQLEGRTRIATEDRREPGKAVAPIVLVPGTAAEAGGGGIRTVPVDAAAETGWRTGLLIYENTPLRQVVADINRYSARQIILDDPALGRRPITATLRIGQTDTILSLLAAGGIATIARQEPNAVHLKAGAD